MTDVAVTHSRILVVEDEVIVAKDIERTLEALGYEVVGRVSTAEEAVAQARACRPDLILMDIHLRGEADGIDAATAIHQELHTPVIFLTAFSDSDTINRAKATEPFAYVLKPFKEPELRAAIEIALHKSRMDAVVRELNEELEGFAYAVAHDLRAPVRAIGGFSEALIEDLGASMTDQVRADVDQLIVASHHMSDLIDGLLVLSRCTRGGLQYDTIDLSAIFTHLLAGLTAGEPARAVTWSVESGMTAHGDVRLVEAVATNLIENAWKFTRHTPAPTIHVFAEHEDGDHGEVFFGVTDNGAGFDLRHADRLFKPFQRLHRQEEFPGIGVGLATVQRIVRRHGGTILASGAVGQGATFRFSLRSAPEGTTP